MRCGTESQRVRAGVCMCCVCVLGGGHRLYDRCACYNPLERETLRQTDRRKAGENVCVFVCGQDDEYTHTMLQTLTRMAKETVVLHFNLEHVGITPSLLTVATCWQLDSVSALSAELERLSALCPLVGSWTVCVGVMPESTVCSVL